MKHLIIFAIVSLVDIFLFDIPCGAWSALTMYMVVCELERNSSKNGGGSNETDI